jgi:hypothetical protein
MTPAQFIAKWSKSTLGEKQAAQQHFLDLCHLFHHPTPADADPTGSWYCFERGAEKRDGGDGWADVWKKDFFGWEYKGKRKDLAEAYKQLDQYRASLENPPLLVVCDLDRFEIHTNFTNTKPQTFVIPLADLDQPRHLEILRHVFHDPDKLRPGAISAAMTEDAAARLGMIADKLRQRGIDPHEVAHFLIRLVFCMFAEDVALLPRGLFTQILDKSHHEPVRFQRLLAQLWSAMATGGDFGAEPIKHFNGNLFDDSAPLLLTTDEMDVIAKASALEWHKVDASIFGTLFTRGIDPKLRSQLGAEYTGRADIETLIEPVVLAPLRRQWHDIRAQTDKLLAAGDAKSRKTAEKLLVDFLHHLRTRRILDASGGSGNFLYVTLQKLLDLEKEVNDYMARHGFTPHFPEVSPRQLYLIEINPYAHSLAQVTVQIGYIQWLHAHGFGFPHEPILIPLNQQFILADALFTDWPTVDFLVGNPPFLGGGMIRSQLGDEYVERLFKEYGDRIPNFSDLCCYWFEKARAQIEAGKMGRAGLLATQGIRGGANREVLKRIKQSGDIFFAESDRDWIQDGANVHVSMVGFDNGTEQHRILDSQQARVINANLTTAADLTEAQPVKANQSICFMGPSPKAPFDISEEIAIQMLKDNSNAHGLPNSDVVRRVQSGVDLTKNDRKVWTVDFAMRSMEEVALYQMPFEHLKTFVYPIRSQNRRKSYAERWWQYAEARPGLRKATEHLFRVVATPEVSKHRLFDWRTAEFLCNQQTLIFARSDDYFFGVLHSRLHEVWALKLGTRLETRPRYTPTTCFETFPFPEPTEAQREAIASAAKQLDTLRTNWLNPADWTREEILAFPATVGGPWHRYIDPSTCSCRAGAPPADAEPSPHTGPAVPQIGTARYPRLVPKDADCAKKLAKRTLTNLYNERPTWLSNAHAALDTAVFAAYGWPTDLTDDQILERLLNLNLEQAADPL